MASVRLPTNAQLAVARLDIQIADFVGVSLDEAPARRDRGTHQHIEGLICGSRVLNSYLKQRAAEGIHGCIPELRGIHFAQALKASQSEFLASKLFDDLFPIFFGIGVLDAVLNVDTVQRRLCDEQMAIFDQLRHITKEERK